MLSLAIICWLHIVVPAVGCYRSIVISCAEIQTPIHADGQCEIYKHRCYEEE